METESFIDQDVASLLNQHFVSVKVDREERPDIDHLYMDFCQILTGSGGWPLTCLLTPEQKPFFAGTYFPKTRRYGRPGLIELLKQVAGLWQNDQTKLRKQAEDITLAVKGHHTPPLAELVGDFEHDRDGWKQNLINQAYEGLKESFDSRYGGFGRAPKFPTPHTLGFLLRYGVSYHDQEALNMVETTLDGMSRGGIWDHIGFGFARYSTDQQWLVPHFEKMLYDNALLIMIYLEIYQMERRPRNAQTAREIIAYVLRDMNSPEGGFYSAEDADSEGIEGLYYVWTKAELTEVLGDELARPFHALYGITEKGNFEGRNIPNRLSMGLDQVAEAYFKGSVPRAAEAMKKARQILLEIRKKRIPPAKDDKILTAWNGLMIGALAKGAQVLNEPIYLEEAKKALNFILEKLRRPDGRLLARYRDGQAAYLGYLNDYAYLIWGLLEIYTSAGQSSYIELALELQKQQDELFFDPDQGGYFLSGQDSEELLIRAKESYDGALPSGNSVTTMNLLRLARITADPLWEEKAQSHLRTMAGYAASYPGGYTFYLQALQYSLDSGMDLILAGPPQSASLIAMRSLFFSRFRPYAALVYRDEEAHQVLSWLKDYPYPIDQPKAYLCRNHACLAPVTEIRELEAYLQQ